MSRTRADRRPPRADSKAAAGLPVRAADPTKFKCQLCGKTLSADRQQPGLPDVWAMCRPCYRLNQDARDKHRNPGTPVGVEDFAR